MKTSFWDKVLMFLYVLIALAFAVCMALRSFGVDLLGGMFAGLEHTAGHFLSVLIGLGLKMCIRDRLMRYFKSSGFPYHEEAAKKFVT